MIRFLQRCAGLWVAARLVYLPGALMLYLLGARLSGEVAVTFSFISGAAVIVLVHTITHYINDVEDVETDEMSIPTAFTGGSRAIQRGLLTAGTLRLAYRVLSAGVCVLAGIEILRGGYVPGLLYLLILALGYAYSGRPFALGRRGLGEVTAAAVMGVLTPVTGAYVVSGGVPVPVMIVAALLFTQTFFARMCTSYPDIDPDQLTGKRTFLVLVGKRRTPLAFALIGLVMALTGWFASRGYPDPAWLKGSSAVTGLTAEVIACLIWRGLPERWAVWVPMLGLGAYAAGLLMVLIAAFPPS